MSTFTGRLDQLEAQLQDFIEGKLARLSPLRGKQDNLARRLVGAMRASALSTGDGILLAPDRFTVLVNPSQTDALVDDKNMLAEFADLLQEIGKEANLHFITTPVVTIAPNDDVPLNQVDVITRFSEGALGKTSTLGDAPQQVDDGSLPPNAFLIINGIQIFPLDKLVVNIGRRSNNHLIIDDPRVSRQHAQIRASHGRFEIFDLDSTGGVFVNQQRVTQRVLHAGDVISLAGIHLIYGQEISLGKTRELPPTPDNDESDPQN
jgi:hypothetical protein